MHATGVSPVFHKPVLARQPHKTRFRAKTCPSTDGNTLNRFQKEIRARACPIANSPPVRHCQHGRLTTQIPAGPCCCSQCNPRHCLRASSGTQIGLARRAGPVHTNTGLARRAGPPAQLLLEFANVRWKRQFLARFQQVWRVFSPPLGCIGLTPSKCIDCGRCVNGVRIPFYISAGQQRPYIAKQ